MIAVFTLRTCPGCLREHADYDTTVSRYCEECQWKLRHGYNECDSCHTLARLNQPNHPATAYLCDPCYNADDPRSDLPTGLTTEARARILDAVSRPTEREDTPLPFDPDDHPTY